MMWFTYTLIGRVSYWLTWTGVGWFWPATGGVVGVAVLVVAPAAEPLEEGVAGAGALS